MTLVLHAEPHPLLDATGLVIRSPAPVATLTTPAAIAELAQPPDRGPAAPFTATEAVKAAVRDLLRHGGYKPSGRSKPASEYLAAAFAKQAFPRINALVDTCNVVSLHSGLPISLVEVDRLDRGGTGTRLAIRIAPAGTAFVFNPSGQTIDAAGLICLYDAQGPSGTPVKDAQRTKTHDGTTSALAIVWGSRALPGRAAEVTRWYRELVGAIPGASVEDVALA